MIETSQRKAGRMPEPIRRLSMAITMDRPESVRAHMAQGADPDARDGRGRTALMQAAYWGSRKCCEALIDLGADATLLDREGRMAADIARWSAQASEDRELATWLRDQARMRQGCAARRGAPRAGGAEDTAQPPWRRAIIRWRRAVRDGIAGARPGLSESVVGAIQDADMEAIEARVRREGEEALHGYSGHGQSALMIALRSGRAEVAVRLLEMGAEAGHPGSAPGREPADGATLVHEAARAGCRAVVDAAAASGADLDRRDSDGETPLLKALWEEDYGAARMLLEAGCRTDIPGRKDLTPAAIAVRHGHPGLVEMLIAAGVEPQALDEDGDEWIIGFASRGHARCCEILLDTGRVDPQAIEYAARSAEIEGYPELAPWLRARRVRQGLRVVSPAPGARGTGQSQPGPAL